MWWDERSLDRFGEMLAGPELAETIRELCRLWEEVRAAMNDYISLDLQKAVDRMQKAVDEASGVAE